MSAQSWGTHWVNIDTMCWPSGASVGSNTEGMQMSAKGRAAARPATASWKAHFDLLERAGQDDGAAVHLGVEAGLGGELGQPVDGEVDLDGARAGVPPLDVVDEVPGELVAVEHARGSRSSGARSSTTSGARELLAVDQGDAGDPPAGRRDLGDRRLRCGPRRRRTAAEAIAWVRPPMPPSGKPQEPSSPSPTSPILWWAMTNAVPGDRGPAHVPMTPETESTPRTCGDSK